MKNYVNGTGKFRFRISKNGSNSILDFTFRFKSLFEIENPFSVRHQYTDGSITKKNLFHTYEFILDYSEYFEKPDALKIQQIKNAEYEGADIFITPHIDCPEQEYQVRIIDEKRQLSTHYKTANKDYIIRFETVKSYNRYSWTDPNNHNVIFSESFFEF